MAELLEKKNLSNKNALLRCLLEAEYLRLSCDTGNGNGNGNVNSNNVALDLDIPVGEEDGGEEVGMGMVYADLEVPLLGDDPIVGTKVYGSDARRMSEKLEKSFAKSDYVIVSKKKLRSALNLCQKKRRSVASFCR